MAEPDDLQLLTVRFLAPWGGVEVLDVLSASRRVGVPLRELQEALQTYGACETDGYAVRPHVTLSDPPEGWCEAARLDV